MELTFQAVNKINNGQKDIQPVLLVREVIPLGETRYRLELSDGKDTIQALTPNGTEAIQKFNVIQVMKFIVNSVQNKNVMIVSELNVIGMGSAEMEDIKPKIASSPAAAASPSSHSHSPAQHTVSNANTPYHNSAYSGSYTTPTKSPSMKVDAKTPDTPVLPISMLNPYSNKWTIKARVTAKSELKSWNKATGSGSFFSVDLLDNDETAIKAMFWKEACDKFFPLIEENQVYYFTGGRVKLSTKNAFNNIKNPYELDIGVGASVIPCLDDSSIKSQHYSIVMIRDVNSCEVNTTIDILALVK